MIRHVIPPSTAVRLFRTHGLYCGTDLETGQHMFLAARHLKTGVHVVGPTGVGKSRLLLWFFSVLAGTGRPVFLFDPKGDLYRAARDWSIRYGLTKRLV